jgi:hypothetical protein
MVFMAHGWMMAAPNASIFRTAFDAVAYPRVVEAYPLDDIRRMREAARRRDINCRAVLVP